MTKPAGGGITKIGADFANLPFDNITVSPSGQMFAIGGAWVGYPPLPSNILYVYYIKTDNSAGPFADIIPISLGVIPLPDPGVGRQGISTIRMCWAGSSLAFNGRNNDAIYTIMGPITYTTATQTVSAFELSYIEILRDNNGTPNGMTRYVIGKIALDTQATDATGITVL
jgi:hypothetical protein